MCGICGTKGLSLDNFQNDFKNMLASLAHRGPDEEGRYFDTQEDLFLGVRRLSIVDLTVTGAQPIYNEDKSLVLVCNAEIYNSFSLKEELTKKNHRFYTKTDVEVIVHLYEEIGERCLARLKGMFAFALWDRKKKILFIARDRLGIKPLYYYNHNGAFAFASELKALLKLPDISKELDLEAVDLYFSLEYVPSPYSILKNIRKLEPGHYLIYKDSQISISGFWNLENHSTGFIDITFNEAAKRLENLLITAVKEHLCGDVALGIFLSGGLDSSSLAVFVNQNLPGKCETFSLGFTEDSYDETKYAKVISKLLSTNHHHHVFTLGDFIGIFPKVTRSLDEPLGDLSVFPTYLLSEFSRKYVKSVFSGEGADELFMGYPTYPAHKYIDGFRQVPLVIKNSFLNILSTYLPVSFKDLSFDFKVRQFMRGGFLQNPCERHLSWMGSFLPSEKQLLYGEGLKNHKTGKATREYCELLFRGKKINEGLKKIQYLDIFSYLSEDLLVKADRMAMAASLEVRLPYLDHDLVEFIWGLPQEFTFQKRLLKFIMKKYLPSRIVRRPKKGFGIPFAQWFDRKEFFELIEIFFREDFIKKQGLFNYGYVKQMLSEHLAQKMNNRKKLGTYIMFQAWHQNNFMPR